MTRNYLGDHAEETSMLKMMMARGIAALAVVTIVMGAREAVAASRTAKVANCPVDPVYNWCAPSLGGETNCDDCCIENFYLGGLCLSDEESGTQWCLCHN